MERRGLINIALPTTTTAPTPHCTPFTLPSNGILDLGPSAAITLTSDAVFKPECTGTNDGVILTDSNFPSSYTQLRDPFYASTIPECYALSAATVISYMLVIMLLITPRTFLHEGAVILGRRGFTNGPSGSDAGIGIGGRPWLQKVAALTVAISLTIATADTFKVAARQYEMGIMDAQALQNEVEDGLELKIIRVISDTFLWLAQAQTLIRLFPRQREKIIIKWTAFALITLDALFSILNNFVYDGNSRPRTFVDAVPALAYLFQLALSLLYAAWVIYYSITKKGFAFYHPQMRNICLVALLSYMAILIPVVFFVTDISKPTLAGWGDYVRWVGAAAASVVVWEWVERIEALERNDKKDGVLGREVFDGDEMLDQHDASDDTWSQPLKSRKRDRNGKGNDHGTGNGHTTGSNGIRWPRTNRYRQSTSSDIECASIGDERIIQRATHREPRPRAPLWPIRPIAAATPVSRTDTASAESTVYAIRYHPISESTPPVRDPEGSLTTSRNDSMEILPAPSPHGEGHEAIKTEAVVEQMEQEPETDPAGDKHKVWHGLTKVNPFKRKVQDPPPEVSAHTVAAREPINSHNPSNRWGVRARLEGFAATQAEKLREKTRTQQNLGPLPVTVIPAPPRRRNLETTLEELEHEEQNRPPISNNQTPHTPPVLPTPSRPQTSETEPPRRPQLQQRLSDPYVPDDLSIHSIHQRGAISFATSGNAPTSPVSPHDAPRERNTPSSRSSSAQVRGPKSPQRDVLPVMVIPAPIRRPRPQDE